MATLTFPFNAKTREGHDVVVLEAFEGRLFGRINLHHKGVDLGWGAMDWNRDGAYFTTTNGYDIVDPDLASVAW